LFGPPMITVLGQRAWVTRTSRVMTDFCLTLAALALL
jgi:hypothetical protein